MRTPSKEKKAPAPTRPRTTPFAKNRFADRGKVAESAVQKFLDKWANAAGFREANRLIDTKAAGRTIRAAAADFEFYCLHEGRPYHGLIEVKETEHEYRLDRSRLTQQPRLRKRALCGGLVYVLILHSTIKKWRCMTPAQMGEPSSKGSWDLRPLPLFDSPGEALQATYDMWGAPA